MSWVYDQWGDRIYTDLATLQPQIQKGLEKTEFSTKQQKQLFSLKTWQKQQELLRVALRVKAEMGDDLWLDFNEFQGVFERVLKHLGEKFMKVIVSYGTQKMCRWGMRGQRDQRRCIFTF